MGRVPSAMRQARVSGFHVGSRRGLPPCHMSHARPASRSQTPPAMTARMRLTGMATLICRMTRLTVVRAVAARRAAVPASSAGIPSLTSDQDSRRPRTMRRADRLSATSSDHLQVVSVIERVSP